MHSTIFRVVRTFSRPTTTCVLPIDFGIAGRVHFSATQVVQAIPVSSVKQLREITGAPMMECKNALVAEGGDVDKAAAWLRKKGMAIAGKKSGRDASQGLIAVKVSESGDSAAIIEVDRRRLLYIISVAL